MVMVKKGTKRPPEFGKKLHEIAISRAQEDIKLGMVYCHHCKTKKPISDFNKNRSSFRGVQNQCKQCRHILSKGYGKTAYANLKKNPLKWKVRMIKGHLHTIGIMCDDSFIEQWIASSKICVYCNTEIKIKDYSVDHIQPRSRGGSDAIDNLHLICISCNMMKGNLTDEEFKELLKFLEDKPTVKKIIQQRLKASGFVYR